MKAVTDESKIYGIRKLMSKAIQFSDWNARGCWNLIEWFVQWNQKNRTGGPKK